MKIRLLYTSIILLLGSTTSLFAQYAQQTITLDKGWNGVYMEVQPDNADCESFFEQWPVTSVSLYNMENTAIQYIENPTEPIDIAAEYLSWIPGHPTGAHSLNQVFAGQAYLIFATNTYSKTITGRPSVPRIEWVPAENVNLLGFRCNDSATFGTYLRGADFDSDTLKIYSIGGTNELAPDASAALGDFTGNINSIPIERGAAYWIICDKVSNFVGPVRVSPAGSSGIIFYAGTSYSEAQFRNNNSTTLDIQLELKESAPSPEGVQPSLPTLYYFDTLEGWKRLNDRLVKTLEPAETWELRLAVDRTGQLVDQPMGGIILCTDISGGRTEIPLEVKYCEQSQTQALWPAGLWVGKASLSHVSQISTGGSIIDGQQAGGTMQYRIIIHVDLQGHCRLLQRAITAGEKDVDGSWDSQLYIDEQNLPSEATTAVRISSTAFGLSNDAEWDETAGGFGEQLCFSYLIAHDDPVNPFRHARHPNHDGLESDFKTPLPSGDDPQNYISAIKPETFSISNQISMVFSTDESNFNTPLWNPEEQVIGTYTHSVLGLRKEGEIKATGTFKLKRISTIGTISTP